MSHRILVTATRLSERILGRPRLAKVARLVTNEVRRDAPNDMTINGEQLVQAAALKARDPVVLDVGGHFGEWSLSLLELSSKAPTLHVFEPSRVTAAQARTNLGDRATVHELGMSDHSGTASLHIVHEGAGSNSVVPFSSHEREAAGVESITLTTVDDFLSQQHIDRVTLLKIDAEGHDLAVMHGAGRTMAEHRVDMIQFEYNWRWVEARSFLLDAFTLCEEHGYRLGKITPQGIETYDRWHYELESFREANYLAYLPAMASSFATIQWWGG